MLDLWKQIDKILLMSTYIDERFLNAIDVHEQTGSANRVSAGISRCQDNTLYDPTRRYWLPKYNTG